MLFDYPICTATHLRERSEAELGSHTPPEMKRFVNADVVAGSISNAITLNRFAYANGNPVSFVDLFGLAAKWLNWAKVGVGVFAIAALATISVLSAGTVPAVIAGAAAVGGAIGGTIGAVSGYMENGVDGAVNGFMVGTVTGAASGAISASGLPVLGVVPLNTMVDVAGYALENNLNEEDIKISEILVTAGTSLFLGTTEIKLKRGITIEWNPSPGWLNKAGSLYNDKEVLEYIIRKEYREALNEYNEKKLLQANLRFENVFSTRLLEYGIDASKNALLAEIINETVTPIAEKIGEYNREKNEANTRK